MLANFRIPFFFLAILITQAGCASEGPLGRQKTGLGFHNVHRGDKCAELKSDVGRARYQVRMVENDAKEKLGDRFNKTERSLLKHPETLRAYTSSLDNLAMAVQNFKSQRCG